MIRNMLKSDLGIVCNLYKEANQFTNKKEILNWTKKNLNLFPNYSLVYLRGDKLIGAISCKIINKNHAHIDDIVVLKSCRNKGIGSKLINFLLNRLSKERIKKVSLWVHWKNFKAIPFYYCHGFKIFRFEKSKCNSNVPDGEEILHMERKLQS